jgi:hypothetical protein
MTRPIHLELFTDFFNKIGQSLPNCFVREMSVHHPIVDIRADIAGRRFGANK